MKKKLTYILLGAVLFITQPTQGQNVETLLKAFDDRQEASTANRFFEALDKAQFTDEKVVFDSHATVDSLCQQVWYWAAEWFYDCQQYGQAEQYGLKALPLYDRGNDERADCLNLLGLIYVRMGDIPKAADYAKQCLEMDMRSSDDDRISSSLNTVAGIYMAGYQAQEAEQYIVQALKHAERANNPMRKAVILGMASEVYHTLNNDERALSYAEQAYKLDSAAGRKPQATIRLSQKASALIGLHRYKEAEDILRNILPVLREMGDQHSTAIALNRMGMALLCQKHQQEAIPYYQEAAMLFSKMGDLYNEIHAHRGLYESYWSINPDSAKAELDLFDKLKDSLYTHSTAESLARYHAEFGNEQLQQENTEVKQAHRTTIIIAIIVLLLVALGAWLLMLWQRRRWQRQMQELVEKIKSLSTEGAEKVGSDESMESSPNADNAENTEKSDNSEAIETIFLMRIVEVVNESLPTGEFSVEAIASRMNMSVQTFRRRLMAASGETPKAYISAIQMERATQLLTGNDDMPINRVATLCGFEDVSSFSHAFRRVYGCSPSQYKER